MLEKSFTVIEILLYLAIFGSFAFVYCKHVLHMFQQNRYELYRYSKWLFNRNNIRPYISLIYIVLVLLAGTLFRKYATLLCLMITVVFTIFLLYAESKKNYVKDLVVTNRVKRQIVVMTILLMLFIYWLIHLFDVDVVGVLCTILPYFLIYLMALITLPVENMIKKYYENKARNIIDNMDNLIKVGITGSYGKTSTKNIINDIINLNYFTLITPASYNTPMGITRTIREQLKPIHEVFICEMGADKVGDISYLMNFVKPKYGIVTSIGPQHLNTFHSIENIINEKMQEIEMLPLDGVGFINLDNDLIRSYEIRNNCRIVSVGIDNKDADLVAEKIRYTKDGSSFMLKYGNKNYKFKTLLLGKHNITNILIGVALALELGIDIKEIVKNVANIRQVEHRLEVKKINNITFIDDAFNSNPVGSRMALDVLQMMPGKRVIVTPGMIDLGSNQNQINKEFGKYMLDKADFVILVGQLQTQSIYDGLKEAGFDLDKVLVVKNVKDAFDYIYKHFSIRDTVLLENDLPDAFNV